MTGPPEDAETARHPLERLPPVVLWALRRVLSGATARAAGASLARRAARAFRAGRYHAALRDWRRREAISPAGPNSAYYIGCCLELIGSPFRARRHYEVSLARKIARSGAESAEVAVSLHNLGVNAAWCRDDPRALDLAEQSVAMLCRVLAATPLDAEAARAELFNPFKKYVFLAESRYRLGDAAGAREACRHALASPDGPGQAKALARLLVLAEALNRGDQIARDMPGLPEALARLCAVLGHEPPEPLATILEDAARTRRLIRELKAAADRFVTDQNPRTM